MKTSKYLPFFYFLMILIAVSCSDSEEDEGGFGIRINPEDNYLERDPGDNVSFTVNLSSNRDLTRYRITESIDGKGSKLIRDQSISGRFHSDFYNYPVPDTFGFGDHEIQLIFSAIDSRGEEMRRAKNIRVRVTDRLLTEFAGNTMYSSASAQFDAFNLLTGTPIYSSDTLAHVRDLSKADSLGTLSRAWTSPVPEIKYVRFNNFDYGNATEQMVRTAYTTGVKNDTLRNLQNDDIILTQINDRYVAVKLVIIDDQSGTVNDRYFFNIKR